MKTITKKKWLRRLFPGVSLYTGEVCKYCYSNPPAWTSFGGILHCDYCKKTRDTVTPWKIPDGKLRKLMQERVWHNNATTIRVKRSIKKKLDALRVKKDESYDDIVSSLLEGVEESKE